MRPPSGNRNRLLAVAGAALVVILAIIVFSSGGGHKKSPSPAGSGGRTRAATKARTVSRSTVTVSVLNATAVPRLAAKYETKLTAAGFRHGNVGTAPGPRQSVSVVYYAPGSQQSAQEAARLVRVATVRPLDPKVRAIAAGAKVVVVLGADKSK
ncbi:MAG TPA: LytR C-terminal domain-containing protein [Solirubrobacteraceae bacterium]|nr:LytR C-terminal domain-containing protein [Solirubrobacteraceae bacterium]